MRSWRVGGQAMQKMERAFMKTMQLSLLVAGFLTMHLLDQTPKKLAEINKKVVGKWVSADRKSRTQERHLGFGDG